MASITATTAATYNPQAWAKDILVFFRARAVLPPLCAHNYEKDASSVRAVLIPQFTESTSASKRSTFGTAASITLTATTESQTTLSLNQMAYKAYEVPLELEAQIYAGYLDKLKKDYGESLAIQMDSEIAADNTNGLDALTAIGADNATVTFPLLLTGVTPLNTTNAPLNDRVAVFSPAACEDLWQIEEIRNNLFQSAVGQLAAGKGQGFIGRAINMDFYMSNDLEAGTAGHKNAIFQKDAIEVAIQRSVQFENGTQIQPASGNGLVRQFAAWMTYGFVLAKSTYGREVDGR